MLYFRNDLKKSFCFYSFVQTEGCVLILVKLTVLLDPGTSVTKDRSVPLSLVTGDHETLKDSPLRSLMISKSTLFSEDSVWVPQRVGWNRLSFFNLCWIYR